MSMIGWWDSIADVFKGGDWLQGEKLDTVSDERNYTSLADEFDVTSAAETGTDELIDADNYLNDNIDDADDDNVNTVRRRLPTSLADNMWQRPAHCYDITHTPLSLVCWGFIVSGIVAGDTCTGKGKGCHTQTGVHAGCSAPVRWPFSP